MYRQGQELAGSLDSRSSKLGTYQSGNSVTYDNIAQSLLLHTARRFLSLADLVAG